MIATNDQKVFALMGRTAALGRASAMASRRACWKLLANELIEDEPQTAVTTAASTTIRTRLSKVGLIILKASLDGKA